MKWILGKFDEAKFYKSEYEKAHRHNLYITSVLEKMVKQLEEIDKKVKELTSLCNK